MSFNPANFELLGQYPAGEQPTYGQTIFGYTTTDILADVVSTYFSIAGEQVRVGDWIAVKASDKNALFRVTSLNPTTPYVGVDKVVDVSVFSGQINF